MSYLIFLVLLAVVVLLVVSQQLRKRAEQKRQRQRFQDQQLKRERIADKRMADNGGLALSALKTEIANEEMTGLPANTEPSTPPKNTARAC